MNANFIGYPNCINTYPLIALDCPSYTLPSHTKHDLPCRQEAGQDLAQVSTALGRVCSLRGCDRVGRGTREDGAAALHLSVGWMQVLGLPPTTTNPSKLTSIVGWQWQGL